MRINSEANWHSAVTYTNVIYRDKQHLKEVMCRRLSYGSPGSTLWGAAKVQRTDCPKTEIRQGVTPEPSRSIRLWSFGPRVQAMESLYGAQAPEGDFPDYATHREELRGLVDRLVLDVVKIASFTSGAFGAAVSELSRFYLHMTTYENMFSCKHHSHLQRVGRL